MRRTFLVLCALIAPIALAACASKPPVGNQLRFVDSKIWEDQLRQALASDEKEVTVVFEGHDVTVNALPDRLDAWLYTISKRSGGKVDFLPDPALPATRNPIALALSFGLTGYKFAAEEYHYFPARDYNAIVYHDPTTGTLTRVVFVHLPKT